MVKTLVLQETNNKVNSGTNSEISPWGCLPNQKGSRPKNEESKRRPTSNYDLSVLRVNKAKRGEEDKV